MTQVLVTANSPGEVAGWLRPLVHSMGRLDEVEKIAVALLPCAFASGQEGRVAEDLPGVSAVLPPSGFLSLLLGRGRPLGLDPGRGGVILHLGGDLFYASLLARRMKWPALAYLWANPLWDKDITTYLVRNQRDRQRILGQGIADDKIRVVGDLVADSAAIQAGRTVMIEKAGIEETTGLVERAEIVGAADPEGGAKEICFMPGSRLKELAVLTPFYAQVAEGMAASRPRVGFSLLISPFLAHDQALGALESPPHRKVGGVKACYDRENSLLITPAGVKIKVIWSGQIAHMAASDLVITLPGTKTGEAASLGVPLLMLMPINLAEEIPMHGLLGWLDWIPGIKQTLKRALVRKAARTWGFAAQPNLIAGREVVPELWGDLTVGQVTSAAIDLLADRGRIDTMVRELAEIYAPSQGASGRVVDELLAVARLRG